MQASPYVKNAAVNAEGTLIVFFRTSVHGRVQMEWTRNTKHPRYGSTAFHSSNSVKLSRYQEFDTREAAYEFAKNEAGL